MDRFIFFFITSALSSLLWPTLLPLWVIPLLIMIMLYCLKSRRVSIAGTLFGILWMSSVGHWLNQTQPENSLFSGRIIVEGEVVSLTAEHDSGRFDFLISSYQGANTHDKTSAEHKVRLSWHEPQFSLAQGQQLQLLVKLKPRWGLANEAGFDYQRWLFSEGYSATGYVITDERNHILMSELSTRQRLAERLMQIDSEQVRWLLALAIGYRGALTAQDWQLLQQTGTAHLVAISGMHLGMVALWSYCLFVFLFTLIRGVFNLNFIVNIRFWAISATLFPCFLYCVLAGFSVPTLRAFLMLCLAWLLLAFEVNWHFRRFVLVSLSLFIVCFPLSIFSLSFWLSFSAILIIWFLLWRFPVNGLSRNFTSRMGYFLRMQIGLSLLMIPLVLLFFGGASLISPMANLLAVPFVTFLLLPMSLLMSLSEIFNLGHSEWLAAWLLDLFSWFESLLIWTAGLPSAWVDIGSVNVVAVLFAAAGLFLVMMPRLPFPRIFYLVLLLPMASFFKDNQQKHWQLDVLDVGQGLSILIRNHGHAILYDTGAAYPSGFNMVEAAVLPVLKKSNIHYLDKVIISHEDNDHAGGFDVLSENITIAQVLRSPYGCNADLGWQWRGLKFEVLWPDLRFSELMNSDNNLSCVVRISDGQHRVLLAGDIEYSVEKALVNLHRQNQIDLSADFLIAPHHGSKTSSTSAFISAVSPQYSFVSAGYLNRWKMPAEDVVKRYQKLNIALINTAETGQISVSFFENSEPEISTWRLNRHKRWYLAPYSQ